MQQLVILETQAQGRRSLNVRATIRRSVKSFNSWLDAKSEFYSILLEEPITRRKALHVGVVLPALMTGAAIFGVELPVLTGLCLAAAGMMVCRLNKEDERKEDKQ